MLKGEKIKLRAIEPKDVDTLYEWENDFELWKVSSTLKPFSKNIITKFVESEHLDIFASKQLRFMIDTIETEPETIGMIDIFDYDPYHNRAGIGIMIHKSQREKGFAFDALQTIDNYCFKYLNFHQLYCNISVKNTKSLNLFEKAAYKINCKRKDWIFTGENFEDIYFLQKINPNHK